MRLADCWRNGKEVHLKPGEGDLDFAALFRLLDARGFKGHYMNAFGIMDDMIRGRDYLADLLDGNYMRASQRRTAPCMKSSSAWHSYRRA